MQERPERMHTMNHDAMCQSLVFFSFLSALWASACFAACGSSAPAGLFLGGTSATAAGLSFLSSSFFAGGFASTFFGAGTWPMTFGGFFLSCAFDEQAQDPTRCRRHHVLQQSKAGSATLQQHAVLCSCGCLILLSFFSADVPERTQPTARRCDATIRA